LAAGTFEPVRVGNPWRRVTASAIAVCAGAACVGVAALVRRGRFAHFDQHAISHWTPWIQPVDHTLWNGLGPETRHAAWGTVVAVVAYPASGFVSGLVVLLCAVLLWARGDRWTSLGVSVAWLAANAIELLGKHAVERPRIRETSWGRHGYLPSLEHSLPSGHVMRALVVAAALAALGRFGRVAYLWALGVGAAVVAIGDHTPTDVIAGLAAGIALVAALHAAAPVRRRSR
jgi:membrane-associated phospholipid phosphatase